jgi:magnesium-transporting ATPase (P-type)
MIIEKEKVGSVLSKPKSWHALTVEESLDALQVKGNEGLTKQEAQSRLASYGLNELKKEEVSHLSNFSFHNLRISNNYSSHCNWAFICCRRSC